MIMSLLISKLLINNLMKNKWLIQSSGFNTHYLLAIVETLEKLKFNFSDFGLIYGNNSIINLENCLEDDLSVNYITRGGTKLLRMVDSFDTINLTGYQKKHIEIYRNKLVNSIDYDVQKFDINYYNTLNLPLLNYDSEYIKYNECKDISFKQNMFIKPSKDLKAFTGGILNSGVTIKEYINNNEHQSFYVDETVVISLIKEIYVEYRFFCIRDQVITGSMYRRNNETIYDSVPNDVLLVAQEYTKLYHPADIFVMDLAITPKGISIVEYNCWNASGLYACDLQKLFYSVNEFK